MEQQLYPASEIHQQAPCLQQQQKSQTGSGPSSNNNNNRFEQCDAVSKDKAIFCDSCSFWQRAISFANALCVHWLHAMAAKCALL
jgi:hypothetical protein